MIYLDSAATAKYTDIDELILRDTTEVLEKYWMNPSSLYASKTKNMVDECRVNIAKFINAKPEEIIFTSSGSESNNMVIQGFVKQCKKEKKRPFIITTNIEHKSILECLDNVDIYEAERYYVGVDTDGYVNLKEMGDILEYRKHDLMHGNYKLLVSVQYANNEIGVIQKDIRSIEFLVHQYNGIFHTDAVQVFGKKSIDVNNLRIDLMSVSGHKISPVLKGVGFLYKRNGINLQPLIYGSQENGLRAGTENLFGIFGLDEAIKYCKYTIDSAPLDMYCYFCDVLTNAFGCKINGGNLHRLHNNISVTFPQNITSEALLYTLEMSDIYVSAGSACNAKEIKPSHVLKAIGLSDEEIMKTIRISFDESITYEEIDEFVNELKKAIELIESEYE